MMMILKYCSLPVGIIPQHGVYALAPDIAMQTHGYVQLCFSSQVALNNQKGVSFWFVSIGSGPAVEWRSGYKLSYNAKVWPGPGFMFGHISHSQGEISSCLDAESAEMLGISKGIFVFLPLRTLKPAQIFFAALSSGSHGLPATWPPN